MVNFTFTEEQELFRKTVREFCEKYIAPRAREIEEGKKIPSDIIAKMAELGLLGLTVSSEYGGIEADAVTAGIVGEELGRADPTCATAVFYLVQASWGFIMNKYGKDEAKAEILPKVTSGKAFIGIATTEPEAGSDLVGMKSVARKEGDTYVLNGEKLYISGVREVMEQMEEGGGYLTLVKTAPELGARGMTFFYVPLKGTPGISTSLFEEMGRRGISTGGFKMENVRLPAKYVVGEENKGFYIAMEGFNYARAIIAAVCAGAAMRAIEEAVEYAKQRKAFGKPIGKFEGIQFKLAEGYAKIDALRWLAYRALWMFDKYQEGVYNPFEVTKVIAEAKLLGPKWAFEVVNDALQVFGAYGYTTECIVEAALRGVRSYMWAEGSSEIMKIIIGRELFGKEFIPYK